MKITLSIMAHPKRMQQACDLYAKLLTQGFEVVNITWDRKNDEWDTGSRALNFGAITGADWHVVLQDDAILPDNFYTHLVGALEKAPDRTLISLYTGTVRPYKDRVIEAVRKARHLHASWIKHYMLLWGVGIVLPTVHIEPLLEFVEGFKDEKYDIRVGLFYQRNRLPVFYTAPSLVDHNDSLGSLIANDYAPEPRRAHFLIAGGGDWNDRVIDL